jgi:Protein of unknown function (DUF3326)
MTMEVQNIIIPFPNFDDFPTLLASLPKGTVRVAFNTCNCEVTITDVENPQRFQRRLFYDGTTFDVVMLLPTGQGYPLGGHAGDAGAVARAMASVCDRFISHPNVFNAADINEMAENSFYVEGYTLTQLLLGNIGLIPSRSNRLLVLISHNEPDLIDSSINAVNAAKVAMGLRADVEILKNEFRMVASNSESGQAVGEIGDLSEIVALIETYNPEAVAITSPIDVGDWNEVAMGYFSSRGDELTVNPWGGVEAILTHALSARFPIPIAHSPTQFSWETFCEEVGVVDPRVAAECVSLTNLHSILKGLSRAPRIVPIEYGITARNIGALVAPLHSLGVATLAARQQGIPIIAVRGNPSQTVLPLTKVSWNKDKLFVVDDYAAAIGILTALRSGVDPTSIKRPLEE